MKSEVGMLGMAMKLSQGNPGALNCIMGMLTEHLIPALTILPKIEELKIYGTDLYVLWSDLCDKDYILMAKLCKDCPGDILKEASSRQDYSGCELVKPYL